MRYFTQNEKLIFILLITSAVIMVIVTLYNSINVPNKNKNIINNKILVIHTSGEIEPDFNEKYIKHMHKMGRYELYSYNKKINSTDIKPSNWNNIASYIANRYNFFDSFVIFIEEDTLAYTASALSFILENLGKPVILTHRNLINALLLASTTNIPEVMVSSQGKLLRGCRVVHDSSDSFSSPNYPDLEPYNALGKPTEKLQIKFMNPKINVIVIKFFPGINEKYLLNILNDKEIHGIVFEMYGNGNGPINKTFMKVIKTLSNNGVIMVGVSQFRKNKNTSIDIRYLKEGMLSGYDMTTTAAFSKLCFLLGNVNDKKIIGKLMDNSFRGEMMTVL